MPPISHPDRRKSLRRREAVPLLNDLEAWLRAQLAKLAPKSSLAGAFRYALAHWGALTRYLEDGRLEIDNNLAENALRPVAMKRSLYAPYSSVWKQRGLRFRFRPTWATPAIQQSCDALAV